MSQLLDISKYGPAAIVTGASSGIGRSFARLLAEAGFQLLLPARRIDRLKALSAELEAWGELQGHNIDVLVIEPGSTDTENYARQGLDPNESDAAWHPDDLARAGLANIANGPILPVGDATERESIMGMARMPRRDALKLFAGG